IRLVAAVVLADGGGRRESLVEPRAQRPEQGCRQAAWRDDRGHASCIVMRIMSSSPRPTRVQLLVTCLVDQFFPDTGMAVVTLLERLGLTVELPANQTCCGQPAFNAG